MFKDREKLYQVYHTMLSTVLTWALTLAINNYFELRVSVFLCVAFSLVPAILIYLFDINHKNAISYLIVLSSFPIAAFVFWVRKFNPFAWLKKVILWCNTYDGSQEYYIASYAKFLIVGVALIGTIIFYLLMKNQSAKIILAVIFVVMLITLSASEFDISKAVVAVCIFYILSNLVELCGRIYSRKVGRQDKREGILYLAPICLLLAVLSISLPSKAEPIQWTSIKQMYRSVKEQINVWMVDIEYYFSNSTGEFGVSFTGYDEDGGDLGNGGKLNKDNKIAMNVSGFKGNKAVYLIGSVSDVYTGDSWEKSKLDFTEGQEEFILDYNELLYALSRQDIKVLEEQQLVQRRSLRIEFLNIKTKTCFYPIKSSYLEMIEKEKGLNTEYANITFPHALGKGTAYKLVSYEMNLKDEFFQQMLRDADKYTYEDVPEISEEMMDVLDNILLTEDYADTELNKQDTFEILKSRAEMIQERYTVLPDTLPDRVKELALQITAGYDNNYDKLKAIESFLSTYLYTLQPGKIPEGEDFVDYFLFDNKKGYCTYYATSMAILARCINIPTRYVEGYVVTFKGEEPSHMYPVKNSQSHAWAEAYIKGVGWIPFEATAPYYNTRYTTWKKKAAPKEGESADYSDLYAQQNMQQQLDNLVPDLNTITQEENKNKFNLFTAVIIFMVTILIILWILVAYYSILKLKYRKAFEKADYSKKMYMTFLRILRLLQLEGFDLDQQETIRMLAQRVKDNFRYRKITFFDIANIFMHYRYAQIAVTKEEFEKVNDFHLSLAKKQRDKMNKLSILLEEFRFLSKKSNR